MTALHYLPATEALRLFQTRQLSPVELMRSVVERAERVEPAVNTFAEQMFEQVLQAAADSERRYRPGGQPRPLEGLPVAAKEEQRIVGHPVTDGTLLRPSYLARETSVVLPRGRNPVLPPAGLDTYFHHGPMARTVADCALL